MNEEIVKYWHYTAENFDDQLFGMFVGSYVELVTYLHKQNLRLVYCKELNFTEATELAKIHKK